MWELKVGEVALMLDALKGASRDALRYSQLGPGFVPPEKKFADSLATVLEVFELFGTSLELDTSLVVCAKAFREKLLTQEPDLRAEVIGPQIEMLTEGLIDNLLRRTFMYVPRSRASFLKQEAFFALPIKDLYKEAARDMQDACKSYAVGLFTASVFHTMRIAERALRLIAQRLNIELIDKGEPLPIAYATWEKVLVAIDAKIKATRQQAKDTTQNQALAFWADAASQIAYLKDLWRNNVMHSRTECNEGEALNALIRVRDVLQLLCYADWSNYD